MIVHPQAVALPPSKVDAAMVLPVLHAHEFTDGRLCVMATVARGDIIGVLTGPRSKHALDSRSMIPLRQMRTYFRHDTQPPARTDSYTLKDVITAYLDVSGSPFLKCKCSATDATAALVQAYDGGNNIQLICVAIDDLMAGEEIVLLQ
jgi:hypothetical protein